MWTDKVSEFVTLLLVISPFEVLPGFLALVGGMSLRLQRRIALQAVLVAFVALVFFMFAGRFVLAQMHIPIRAFQIAGGIVLFLVALEMVRGVRHEATGESDSQLGLAIYPLGIPKIAGPGAMLAVMVLSDDDRFNLVGQLQSVIVVALVLVTQLLILLAAGPISRVIGTVGAGVIGRIMGILLAALAVSMVLTAFAAWLSLPPL